MPTSSSRAGNLQQVHRIAGPKMTNPDNRRQQPHFALFDCIGRGVVLNLSRTVDADQHTWKICSAHGKTQMAAQPPQPKRFAVKDQLPLRSCCVPYWFHETRGAIHKVNAAQCLVHLECYLGLPVFVSTWPQSYRRNVVSLFC
jgi:hypothetical protein